MVSAATVAPTLLALADGCARRANRSEEKKPSETTELKMRDTVGLFLNTYTESYTLSHLLEINPTKPGIFRHSQTT
jgi:hypothetical protein